MPAASRAGGVVVEAAALVEYLGFRRVQVFRPRIWIQRAPAQPDAPPTRIADREQDAAPEAVVGRAAVFWFGGEAGVDDKVRRDAFFGQSREHTLSGVGGVTNLEAFLCRLVRGPAAPDSRAIPRLHWFSACMR